MSVAVALAKAGVELPGAVPVPAMRSADSLLQVLTEQQYITPHERLRDVLDRLVDRAELCPAAVRRAVSWLRLDANQAIGRLRRTELTQLARCVDRYQRGIDTAAMRTISATTTVAPPADDGSTP